MYAIVRNGSKQYKAEVGSVIKFEKPVEQINEEIMANGIGHHWMVGYGDFRKELARFCKIKGIRYFEI